MAPWSLCFGSQLALNDLAIKPIYTVQAPPPEATQHQRNLISELVLNGCDREFATKVVLEHGEDRPAVWREMAKALDANTLPASSELPVGRGLDTKEWAQKVARRREKLNKWIDAAAQQPVAGADPEEADDVLRAFENCGTLDRKKVVMILKVQNAALQARFERQAAKLGGAMIKEQLFLAASLGRAEAIAVKGLKAAGKWGNHVALSRDSGSALFESAPIAKKGFKPKYVPTVLAGCQTLVLSSVLVPASAKGQMDHSLEAKAAAAVPDYIIFYA